MGFGSGLFVKPSCGADCEILEEQWRGTPLMVISVTTCDIVWE